MQAGRLRDRVIILNVTTARSPSGHPVETVTEGATVWAEVKGISGREIISGGHRPLSVRASGGDGDGGSYRMGRS